MNLAHYRLVAQIGAGWDGVAYRAIDTRDEHPVEIRLLGGARVDARRWAKVTRRLRLAAQLDHPSIVHIRELALEHQPPFVVLDSLEGKPLADESSAAVRSKPEHALAIAADIADAVAEGHRLGLAHGRLGPASVFILSHQSSARPRTAGNAPSTAIAIQTGLALDFAGVETQPVRFVPEIEAACRAPGTKPGSPDTAADVYAVAALFVWMVTRKTVTKGVADLQRLGPALADIPKLVAAALTDYLTQMLAADPAERPTAWEAREQLRRLHGAVDAPNGLAETNQMLLEDQPLDDAVPRTQLGRFRLLDKLGQGGMGRVYRAEDTADGRVVAIKVLNPDWARNSNALRRFHKEARLLAEVNNPYITNLLEVNEDGGIHYLALEFVPGQSVGKMLKERGKLEERVALSVMADVARALADAHERGIVHRDVKPDNILIADCGLRIADSQAKGTCEARENPQSVVRNPQSESPQSAVRNPPSDWHVKLSDFGLARHVDQTESMMVTQKGALLGTPLYMSPEQCSNGKVEPPSDVYAMGATLFHLLAGRPPFTGDTPLSIIMAHSSEPPPALRKLNPALSEAVCQVVEKMLAKSPTARFPNAGALLGELERLLRGEPTSIAVHPQLPADGDKRAIPYDFTWELEAAPAELWPHVSNTERLNRAIGLSAVEFTTQPFKSGGSERFGKIQKLGMTMAWQEHPFEWVEGRRMGVLREFSQGPFRWFISIVELNPRRGGGTTLVHRIRVEPRGILGRTAAAVEIGTRGKRALERVYRRIDAAVTGKLGRDVWVDPFEAPTALGSAQRSRLDALLGKLVQRGVDAAVAERLGDFLANASAQDVARIRPIALARRLALEPDAVVNACLHGAREGLLLLLWDILCPICRIPSRVQQTLRDLKSHGRCEACNLDFELDFANSVEVIFRAHPEIRDTELGVFCIGGPAHSPHVAAQARVAPGERMELDLALPEGAYRLRGPQLPYSLDFRIETNAGTRRWDLVLSRGRDAVSPRGLRTGGQLIALTNDFKQEVVVRIERAAPRDDALTAARAASLALFRELFPSEVLAPGQLISIATVTLLVTDLDGGDKLYTELGDARAFALIHEHLRQLDDRVRREGGAVVKAIGCGIVAAFNEAAAAVRAALALPKEVADPSLKRRLSLRAGVHRGPAMAATINDHLDYFGTTAGTALMLPALVAGGELALTATVAADPQVAALLEERGAKLQVFEQMLLGTQAEIIHRMWIG
jgi:serine/threonine protein kinase/class 3 adenylate cyclase